MPQIVAESTSQLKPIHSVTLTSVFKAEIAVVPDKSHCWPQFWQDFAYENARPQPQMPVPPMTS